MSEAEVGDDAYGEDPTVNRLQEACAALLGKEAALFVPSGTMANQLAIMTQTNRGEEFICDEGAHVKNFERGAASALSGVAPRAVSAPGGRVTSEQIAEVMASAGRHFPPISLVVWENSHNLSGGQVVPPEILQSGILEARRHGLSVHLDGARIFNAAVYLGIEAAEIAEGSDTVQFCFSKGLGAPVGSILCGSDALIARARNLRKMLGGGMRQAGVLAAAAEVALSNRGRLEEDHRSARYLADSFNNRVEGCVSIESVHTNIVNVDPSALPRSIPDTLDALRAVGVKANAPIGKMWRLVTHQDVNNQDVDRLVAAVFET